MPTFKIIIKNQSTTEGRTYNVLAAPPAVHGGANPPVRLVTWQRTVLPLSPGEQTEFVFTEDLFAFVGVANTNSAALQPGTTVTVRSHHPVNWKTRFNNGVQLAVGKDLMLRSYGKSATRGTFHVTADASLPTRNNFVVGLARSYEGSMGGPSPVAAVELKPGVTYKFTPSLAVWVIGGERQEGEVQDAPVQGARDAALVEFDGVFNTALVLEQNNGHFQVSYSTDI